MKKGLLLGLAFGLGAVAALAQQEFITFGSGGATGVYFPVATGIAKQMSDANVGLRANARTTGGSVVNINGIASGEFQMALAQNDTSYYAYNGVTLAAFKDKPIKSIRAVAALYPEVVHVVALKASKIDSVDDLKGKKVVLGDIGSGTEQNALQMLEVHGLKESDLGQAIRATPTQASQLLQDGKADVMFFTGGLGNAAVQQLTLTAPVNLVSVNLNAVKPLAKKYPFYVGFNIPSGTYKGADVTVPTVAVQAMWITSDKLSDDAVYNTLKATVGNEAAFKAIHPNLQRFFSLSNAVKGLPIPLHNGAMRFYKEKGVLK
jgi:uncharacterized protein